MSNNIWWEPRRENELTPDYLGRVLDRAGLTEMAKKARLGHYDDFFAPPEVADGLELLHLTNELRKEARVKQLSGQGMECTRILVIINAVKHGEFDATKEESERWAASKDGQETFARLAGEK